MGGTDMARGLVSGVFDGAGRPAVQKCSSEHGTAYSLR